MGELLRQLAASPAAAAVWLRCWVGCSIRKGGVEGMDAQGCTQQLVLCVQVSFGGGETMSLKQLSGGQKTLVALALIFAIQVGAAALGSH